MWHVERNNKKNRACLEPDQKERRDNNGDRVYLGPKEADGEKGALADVSLSGNRWLLHPANVRKFVRSQTSVERQSSRGIQKRSQVKTSKVKQPKQKHPSRIGKSIVHSHTTSFQRRRGHWNWADARHPNDLSMQPALDAGPQSNYAGTWQSPMNKLTLEQFAPSGFRAAEHGRSMAHPWSPSLLGGPSVPYPSFPGHAIAYGMINYSHQQPVDGSQLTR